MNLTDIATKLNQNARSLGEKDGLFCQFYGGKFNLLARKILKSVAPDSRIAVLTLKEEYEEKCKPFIDELKNNGFKATSVLLPDKILSVELISKMFCIKEDVRAVVVLNAKAFGVGCYLSYAKNIDLVCACDSLDFFKNFYFRALVKNGDKLDYVKCPAKTHVVLDEKLIKVSASEIYALAVSKLPAVFDYQIIKAIKGQAFKEENQDLAFNLFCSAIKNVFNTFSVQKEKQGEHLVFYALLSLLANAYSFGGLLDYSCPVAVEKLMAGEASGHALLYSASAILSCYDMILSNKYNNVLETPDYLDRARQLKEIFGCGERQFLEGLKNQISLINALDKSKLEKIKGAITIDNKPVFSLGDKLINTYFALGGKDSLDKTAVIKAVNLSGDLPEFIGGMSLVRESGLAEMMMRLFLR